VNVKEYISSGIIESYVLGLASEAERQEFELLCGQHLEIAEARDAFERSLEEQMLLDAPAPPAHLKAQVEQRLLGLAADPLPETIYEGTTPVRRLNAWKWLAAASVLLLAGTVYWAVQTNNRYLDLQRANQDLQERLNNTSGQLAQLKEMGKMMEDPHVQVASLKAMPVAPQAAAKVFWDTTSKDVYLMINNLPQPATGKQYQLWALINSEHVDLGVFEIQEKPLMLRMKNVQNAQAFAVTLEPKGGSPAPTGDMYVMGRL
jgi:anti-sigma-K factor RskA